MKSNQGTGWPKRILAGGALFFLLKGLVWIGAFAFAAWATTSG